MILFFLFSIIAYEALPYKIFWARGTLRSRLLSARFRWPVHLQETHSVELAAPVLLQNPAKAPDRLRLLQNSAKTSNRL